MIAFQPLTLAEVLTILVSFTQTGLIAWGLWQMRIASHERNR